MPRLSLRPPKYRKHKASGQALVTLNGRDFYLGPHGSPESRADYDRLVAEWQLPAIGGIASTKGLSCVTSCSLAAVNA